MPVNSDELNAGWKLTLPQSVRRHAIQAMRLKDGDELQLSDGKGLRIHAVLRDAQQGIAEVSKLRQRTAAYHQTRFDPSAGENRTR